MNAKQFHDAACKIAGPTFSVSTQSERWKFSHRDKNDPVTYKVSVLKGTWCEQVETRSMKKTLTLLKPIVESYNGEKQ